MRLHITYSTFIWHLIIRVQVRTKPFFSWCTLQLLSFALCDIGIIVSSYINNSSFIVHLGIQLQVYVSSLSTPKVLKIYRKTVPSFLFRRSSLPTFLILKFYIDGIISSLPCSACFSELKLLTSTHWPTMRSRWLDICHIIFFTCLLTKPESRSKTMQKRTMPFFNNLDRTSFVKYKNSYMGCTTNSSQLWDAVHDLKILPSGLLG